MRGDKVTPASDLFSLGVLLYELVTGIRPYAGKNRTAFEVEKAILDTTPILPSTQAHRNGGLAAELRGTTPDKLRCLLKGDIDNIILVALRTAPERRYTTASALGDDIRRHLEALPVAARSDSIGYRASTFIRRNKRAAAVAGLGVVAVGAVTGIAVWQGRGAVAQRQALEGRSSEASRFGIELLNDVYRNQKKMSNRGIKGTEGAGPGFPGRHAGRPRQ